MNAQDYISSGLLEAYVLGSLTSAESEQVIGAMCRFPEVAAEVAAYEALIIQSAEEEAIPPPANMQDKIWAAIEASGASRTASPQPSGEAGPAPQPAPRIIPLSGSPSARPASWARAATWLLLAGSVVANIALWSGRNTDQQELAGLRQNVSRLGQEQESLAASLRQHKISLERYQQEADMMAQPGVQPIAMLSMLPGKPMAATLYWNKKKHEAYVSVQKLPPPPAGMQYQLWAIDDGKPVSIGMMENEVALHQGMQKVSEAVAAGEAFAVSLEKTGGNPVPTADKIFLMGKMPAA